MADVARDVAWETLRSQFPKSSVTALEDAEKTQLTAWQTLRSPRTPRKTRTPRMETRLRPGDGVITWKNFEEQRAQELLYRSEYFSGLLSSAIEVEASPPEDMQATLKASPAPLLIQAVSDRLDLANAKPGFTPPKMVLPATDVLHNRPRLGWPQEGHYYPNTPLVSALVQPQAACLKQTAQGRRARWVQELAQEASEHRPATSPLAWDSRVRSPLTAATTAGSTQEPADVQSITATALQSLDAWRETCEGVNTMLESGPAVLGAVPISKAAHRLNNTAKKVASVPGVHDEAFGRDHKATFEAQRSRELNGCEHIFSLLEDGISGKATQAELQYARLFSQLKLTNNQVFPKQFHRFDGLEASSTHRYTLTDVATSIIRKDDGFHKLPALLTSMDTVPLFADGHYFEVKVTSVFSSLGPATRPKPDESRGRSAGLVLGLMALPPSLEDEKAKYASDLSGCWCISTHGFYYARPGKRPCSPTRRASDVRVAATELPVSWRRKKPVHRPAPGKQLVCSWPATSTGEPAASHKLDWSVALNEGDSLGLLLLPSGALMMTCNGRRVLTIADAALPTDRMYFPLVEVSNHIRSIKLAHMASPPP